MNEIQQKISKIIRGLTIYIIASITTSIVTTISMTSIKLSVVDGESTLVALFVGGIINFVIFTSVIYGLIIYYTGLKSLAPMLDAVGEKGAKNLAYGAILIIIAPFCSLGSLFIPFLGTLPFTLCSIAAFILNILGALALQKSESLNELGKRGAKQLYIGFIFAMLALCVSQIPLLDAVQALDWVPTFCKILAFVLKIMYWVCLLRGWLKIRASFIN